jgi:hypothetical protein
LLQATCAWDAAGLATPPEDSLAVLHAQVEELSGRGWAETVIPRPYVVLSSALAKALQHSLPALTLPGPNAAAITPSQSWLVAPPPLARVAFRLFPSAVTSPADKPDFSHMVERHVLETHVRNILVAYTNNFRRASQTLGTLDGSLAPVDHIVIEVGC